MKRFFLALITIGLLAAPNFANAWYDPTSASFLSFDPLGFDSSDTGYTYCNGDPVNHFDPDGRLSARNTTTGIINAQPPYEMGVAPVMQTSIYTDYHFVDGTSTGFIPPSQPIAYDPNQLGGRYLESRTEPTGQYFGYVRDTTYPSPLADPNYGQTIRTPITTYDVQQQQRLRFLGAVPGMLMTLDTGGGFLDSLGYATLEDSVTTAGSRSLVSYYPPNQGVAGPSGQATLIPGTIADRYGGTGGSFLSPQGTPSWARSLPFGAETRSLNAYEVLKPIDVNAGTAAPWFNQPGGGLQFDLGTRTVQDLLDSGHLGLIK